MNVHPVNVYPLLGNVLVVSYVYVVAEIVPDTFVDAVLGLFELKLILYSLAVQFAVNVGVALLSDAKFLKYVPLFLFTPLFGQALRLPAAWPVRNLSKFFTQNPVVL